MKVIVQVFSFKVLAKIFMGLATILIIRFMPEIEYARYVFVVAIINISTQILASSFNGIFIIGFQHLKLKTISSSFLSFQLIGVTSLMILLLPFINFFRGLYWYVIGTIFITCMAEFAKTIYQQELKFFRFSIFELSRTVIFFLGLLFLSHLFRDSLKAELVLLVQMTALILVFLFAFSGRFAILKGFLMFNKVSDLVVSVFKTDYKYLFGYFSVLAILIHTDIFMLKAMTSNLELAAYGSAFRYYTILILSLGAVNTVLLPVIQKAENILEVRKIFQKHKKLVVLFGSLVLFGGWASQWIIPWIDRGKYPSAVPVFQILALSAVISFAFSPHSSLVLRFKEFKFLFKLAGLALLINATLNLILIPLVGVIGASIATLISFACVNGTTYLRANGLIAKRQSLVQN